MDSRVCPAAQLTTSMTASTTPGRPALASLPAKPESQYAAAAHIWPVATSTGAGELHKAVPVRRPIGPMVVYNDISQRRQRRTEPRPQATCTMFEFNVIKS